jgi:ABC-type transporter Mla maintaining outer membrane lipid asymmetry ATPase subunit MlaF
MFDYEFDGTTTFEPPEISPIDREMTMGKEWGIGVIVGPSGSGKSTLLDQFGKEQAIVWDADKAICSHFENATDAEERLSSVGFCIFFGCTFQLIFVFFIVVLAH